MSLRERYYLHAACEQKSRILTGDKTLGANCSANGWFLQKETIVAACKISTVSSPVLVFQRLLCWTWWNLQHLQSPQWYFRRGPAHDFWTVIHLHSGHQVPLWGWARWALLLCSQRQPDPARVPAGSWAVPMADLIVWASSNWHGWISHPVKQKAKFAFWNTAFFSSGINPRYENGCSETVSLEMGTVPQLGVSSGRDFSL